MKLIPEHLRRALEDGVVVFFCGAGVSVPAGLPSFKGLVEDVLRDLVPPADKCRVGSTGALAWRAFDKERYDEALDVLETRRGGGFAPRDVRDRVRYHLTKRKRPRDDKHLVLARLADLDRSAGRLVTTNFDPLFERACRKLCKTEGLRPHLRPHIAPALPPAKPETFSGLVYLHGKLDQTADNRGLVLTTADFGTAYLLEGWARRFVVEMFRHYHVVFLGYRVEDPTMRYLVSALAAAREENRQFKEAYAFVPFGYGDGAPATQADAEQEWIAKGLVPLAYKSDRGHSALWDELEQWALDHRQGVVGRQQTVARLGQFPPADESDAAIDEMAWALSSPAVAEHFGNLAGAERPSAGWLRHLQRAGTLGKEPTSSHGVPLVFHRSTDCLSLDDCRRPLGRWIANCIETPEAVEWVLQNGGVLHRDVRFDVQQRLDSEHTIGKALVTFWRVLSDEWYSSSLPRKWPQNYPAWPRVGPGRSLDNTLFLERLTPIPTFRVRSSYFSPVPAKRDPDEPLDWYEVELELLGIRDKYSLERMQTEAVDWQGALVSLADDITTRLSEALSWLSTFGKVTEARDLTIYDYRSISPHPQNEYAEVWTSLIDLARASHEALVQQGSISTARCLARRWKAANLPLFRRLTLHAATNPEADDLDLGIETLLDGPRPALWDPICKREALRFMRKRGAELSRTQLARLSKEIVSGPRASKGSKRRRKKDRENDQRRRDFAVLQRLHKLVESGAKLPSNAQQKHADLLHVIQWEPPEDRSDEFAVYISSGPAPDEPTVALLNFKAMDVDAFIDWGMSQVGEPWDCGGGWRDFVHTDPRSALMLLARAARRGSWPVAPWYAALGVRNDKGVWNEAGTSLAARVLQRMPLEDMSRIALQAAQWLEATFDILPQPTRLALFRRLWDASQIAADPADEWDFDMTLNHAGGVLGHVLYKEMSEEIPRVGPGDGRGLPEHLRADFEKLDGDSASTQIARARIAPMLLFLFRVDPGWTRRVMLSRMNLQNPDRFDHHLWEAYLWSPRWGDDLLPDLKPLFLGILANLEVVPERVRDHAPQLFIHMAIPPDRAITREEAMGVLHGLGPDLLADAVSALRAIVEAAGDKSKELWERSIGPWFRSVWPKRMQDRSQELSERLAWMATNSGNAFPHVVDDIEPYLMRERYAAALHHLVATEKETGLITRFPKHSLVLARKLVGDAAPPHRDLLREALAAIASADPALTKDADFTHLQNML